jgi:hypothetical protein
MNTSALTNSRPIARCRTMAMSDVPIGTRSRSYARSIHNSPFMCFYELLGLISFGYLLGIFAIVFGGAGLMTKSVRQWSFSKWPLQGARRWLLAYSLSLPGLAAHSLRSRHYDR